ncbi:Calcium-transporting ATPase 1 [Hondaea fermentalgiana]|uniref:Calcium-transporting ATPase 1 n=1 Tax=Hondaea fermentalgiana TaxID=2315210 RepID=A0A2R5G258_9STRA|nr:Calcium-transporting ATPase 1 [Hondaea fermentalgiana]|eukprot:GBG25072.1 Calcium-transporting ATPase 1 [Hondaea fermentalgiana]
MTWIQQDNLNRGNLTSARPHGAAQGLSDGAAQRALQRYGPNEPTQASVWETVLEHLGPLAKNPLIVLLGVLGTLAYVGGDAETGLVIWAMGLLAIGMQTIQEFRGEQAASALRAQLRTHCRVSRGPEGASPVQVQARDVVPGDLLLLSAGDLVPADGIVLSCAHLRVNQAQLTGESLPVAKRAANPTPSTLVDARAAFAPDAAYTVLTGTMVVAGHGIVRVTHTGDDSEMGKTFGALRGARSRTGFDEDMDAFTMLMIRFIIFMAPTVFLLQLLRGNETLDAFLYAAAVAVGLAPEMLPMILTYCLIYGATELAKKEKCIVKRLNALQAFGSMDVLCTDKTGTLTQDSLSVNRSLDACGQPAQALSKLPLLLCKLSAHFQSAAANNAVERAIDGSPLDSFDSIVTCFSLVDEDPFDYEQRFSRVRVRLSKITQAPSPTQGELFSILSPILGHVGNAAEICIYKGAVEEVLALCHGGYLGQQGIGALTDLAANSVVEQIRATGERILAVAIESPLSKDLLLAGFVSFADPPKPSAAPAIEAVEALGISVRMLTGDTASVATHVAAQVGIHNPQHVIEGQTLDLAPAASLRSIVQSCNVFARLTPHHKRVIIRELQALGHSVGFVGDGVNDVAALQAADVGISVDSACDAARAAADVLLTRKSLRIFRPATLMGRRVFLNMIKYIKMAASSNFGNMWSVLSASLFIPFLPMLPIQVVTSNFLYDIAQLGIPSDAVDKAQLSRPLRLNMSYLFRFIVLIGLISSIFDSVTFATLYFMLGADESQQPLFHTGWFVEGLVSQTLVVFVLRLNEDDQRSFFSRLLPRPAKSRVNKGSPVSAPPSSTLVLLSGFVCVSAATMTLVPFVRELFGFVELPLVYWAYLAAIIGTYLISTRLLTTDLGDDKLMVHEAGVAAAGDAGDAGEEQQQETAQQRNGDAAAAHAKAEAAAEATERFLSGDVDAVAETKPAHLKRKVNMSKSALDAGMLKKVKSNKAGANRWTIEDISEEDREAGIPLWDIQKEELPEETQEKTNEADDSPKDGNEPKVNINNGARDPNEDSAQNMSDSKGEEEEAQGGTDGSNDVNGEKHAPRRSGRKRPQKTLKIENMEESNRDGKKTVNPADVKYKQKKPIREKKEPHHVRLNPIFSRVLKPHQAVGVRFLWSHVQSARHSGCILADYMGLGKTLQNISLMHTFLAHHKDEVDPKRKTTILVVSPTSVILNWYREIHKWLSPKKKEEKRALDLFNVQVLDAKTGTRLDQRLAVLKKWQAEGGVLLTGYEMFRSLAQEPKEGTDSRKAQLARDLLVDGPGPSLVIVDEGHRLRQAKSQIVKAMSRIKTRRRIVLTGYPLQNHLEEYWCMVNFARPGYLKTSEAFKHQFKIPIENGQALDSAPEDVKFARSRTIVLNDLLRSIILRRDSQHLARELPPKYEWVLRCRLTGKQAELYRAFARNRVDQAKARENGGASASQNGGIIAAYHHSLSIVNHPDIIYEKYRQHTPLGNERGSRDSAYASLSIFVPSDLGDLGINVVQQNLAKSRHDRTEATVTFVDAVFDLSKCPDPSLPWFELLDEVVSIDDSPCSRANFNDLLFRKQVQARDIGAPVRIIVRRWHRASWTNVQLTAKVAARKLQDSMALMSPTHAAAACPPKDPELTDEELREEDRRLEHLKDAEVNRTLAEMEDEDGIVAIESEPATAGQESSYSWAHLPLKSFKPGKRLSDSGKMIILFSILRSARQQTDKVIVFSQSVQTLNVVQQIIEFHNSRVEEQLRIIDDDDSESDSDDSDSDGSDSSDDDDEENEEVVGKVDNEKTNGSRTDEMNAATPQGDRWRRPINQVVAAADLEEDDDHALGLQGEAASGGAKRKREGAPLLRRSRTKKVASPTAADATSSKKARRKARQERRMKIEPGSDACPYLPGVRIGFSRLDGATPQATRNALVDAFNAAPIKDKCVFLASTRAAGEGLNLQSANRVVMFDACWNPCLDHEAMCRAYRFGQKKPVFVYRLVAAGTMERTIFDQQTKKESLTSRVVDARATKRTVTSSDLRNFFNLRRFNQLQQRSVNTDKLLKDIGHGEPDEADLEEADLEDADREARGVAAGSEKNERNGKQPSSAAKAQGANRKNGAGTGAESSTVTVAGSDEGQTQSSSSSASEAKTEAMEDEVEAVTDPVVTKKEMQQKRGIREDRVLQGVLRSEQQGGKYITEFCLEDLLLNEDEAERQTEEARDEALMEFRELERIEMELIKSGRADATSAPALAAQMYNNARSSGTARGREMAEFNSGARTPFHSTNGRHFQANNVFNSASAFQQLVNYSNYNQVRQQELQARAQVPLQPFIVFRHLDPNYQTRLDDFYMSKQIPASKGCGVFNRLHVLVIRKRMPDAEDIIEELQKHGALVTNDATVSSNGPMEMGRSGPHLNKLQ